jgi:PIN domain
MPIYARSGVRGSANFARKWYRVSGCKANLRATLGLKTPDAIHVATALLNDSMLFVTNDSAFRRVADLNVTMLNELIK